jgi:nucleoside-diphosphate-sugar epimerase
MAAHFTVFGAGGYIGRHLVAHLKSQGHDVLALERGDNPPAGNLGHGVYCIGMTADFRSQPFNTARAHVGVLTEILDRCRFDSFLYLSSTRVYAGADTASEDAILKVRPENPDHLYNVTKMAGEALCLAASPERWRVVRLANVIGPGDARTNFLPSVIADARERGRVLLRTAASSAKDYVSVSDVVRAIERVALEGRRRVYNIASGRNTSNAEIAGLLRGKFGADVLYEQDAVPISFPEIEISRIADEFGFVPMPFESAFDGACLPQEEVT